MKVTIAWLIAQMRKDFASVRWLVIVWLIVSLMGVLDGCTMGGLSRVLGPGTRQWTSGIGMGLLPLVFIGALFQEEPVFGRNRNWMLRPPGAGGAIVAKALLLAAFLGVIFLIESLALILTGSAPLFAAGVAANACVQTGLGWAVVAALAFLAPNPVQCALVLAIAWIGRNFLLGTVYHGIVARVLQTQGESPVKTFVVGLSVVVVVTAAVRWRRRWVVMVLLAGCLFVLTRPRVTGLGLPFGGRVTANPNLLLACDRAIQSSAMRLFGARQMQFQGHPSVPAGSSAFSGAFVSTSPADVDGTLGRLGMVSLPHWPQGWILVANQTMANAEVPYYSRFYRARDFDENEAHHLSDLVGDFDLSMQPLLHRRGSQVEGLPSSVSLRLTAYNLGTHLEDALSPPFIIEPRIAMSAYAPVVLADLPLDAEGTGGTNDFTLRTWREGDHAVVRLIRRTTLFSRVSALPRPFLRCVGEAGHETVLDLGKAAGVRRSPAGEWSFEDAWFVLRDPGDLKGWSRVRIQLVVYEYRESAMLEVRKE